MKKTLFYSVYSALIAFAVVSCSTPQPASTVKLTPVSYSEMPPNPASTPSKKPRPAAVPLGSPTVTLPAVSLAWDAVTDPRVNHYHVYQGVSSRNYTNFNTVNVPTTTTSFSNLVRGVTYYFAATCSTTNGLESQYSTEVSYTTEALPPVVPNLRLTVLSAAFLDGPWSPLTNLTLAINTNFPANFFKLEAEKQ